MKKVMKRNNGRMTRWRRLVLHMRTPTRSFQCFVYRVTFLLAMLSLLTVLLPSLPEMVAITIEVAAGCAVALSVYYLYQHLRQSIKEKITIGFKADSLIQRLVFDYHERTILLAHLSLGFNVFFALSNGVFGVLYHSVWFGALSGYYLILSTMRFLAIHYERGHRNKVKTRLAKQKELQVFRNNGVLFIVLNLALYLSIIQTVYYGQAKSYTGTLIFAVAAYTFYKVTIAVFHLFKVRKMDSLLLCVIRNIGYADALVSLVSLQTAMLISFGNGSDNKKINLVTGSMVCLMIFVMGVSMIRSATKQLAEL